ncbi:TniB family NTP-binding protein [Actinomadura harenae]|uniref:TniB family NTP-binding protein n=1 Tax=Actinomadura harenae TaxID=2483351 RepID=UPI002279D4F0|nr:TniB family NTP-binding protein [Actinomadura harenae]
MEFLSDPIVVNTPTIQQVIKTVRRLLILNRRQISARRGLIITGGGGTGKTTAITQLGRAHEISVRLRHPEPQHRIPVIYVTVPPAATPRMLAAEFARFLGLPVARRDNITDITNAVCAVLSDVGCDLVLVDELHNLNLATRAGAEVSDQLKYFAERIPATFILAGIDVERVGLFSGTRGRQIASRFSTLSTQPFAHGTPTQRDNWRSLVLTLEQALPLHQHKPGTLARHGEYLYRRTGGMLGSLSHVIRGAAIDAILDDTEKITKAHLQAILLDHQAEHGLAMKAAPSRPRKQQGAA